MPVSSFGYALGFKKFTFYPLPLNETGFVTVTLTLTDTHKVFSWFEGALRAWGINMATERVMPCGIRGPVVR